MIFSFFVILAFIKLSNNISKIWYNITVLFNLGVIIVWVEKKKEKYVKQLEKTAKEIIKNID